MSINLRTKNIATQAKGWLMGLSLACFLSLVFYACTYNTSVVDPETNEEFIFSATDLANYSTWDVLGTKYRDDIGQNRTIYVKVPDGQTVTDGIYPTGTIIVKEGRNGSSNQVELLHVMAKRGGSFNPTANGWEWATSNGANSVLLEDLRRGDNSLLTTTGKTCISCHLGHTDLVFGPENYD